MHRQDTQLLRTLRHPVEEILTMGGDTRLAIDAGTGLSKYGCSNRPRPETLPFGSCTASSISTVGYEAAARLHRRLLAIDDEADLSSAVGERLDALRDEILFLLTHCSVPGVEVVLSPSGTDVELLALALRQGSDGAPVTNILVGPTEVGSGSPLAAAGRHFDTMTPNGDPREPGDPVDEKLAGCTEVVNVWVRDGNGLARAERDLDSEVEALVHEHTARGRRILLHVVAHSKTGLHAPSLATVNLLRARYGDQVLMVIDAAQGRFSRRGVAEVLNDGHMVVITGSKFFGGPPFCGALLVPPNVQPDACGLTRLPADFSDYFTADQLPPTWRRLGSDLPPTGNLGLLLRWTAAVAEMREYYSTPSQLRLRVLRAFEHLAPEILSSSPNIQVETSSPPILSDDFDRVLQSKATVFSFSLRDADGRRFDAESLRRVWHWLNIDACDLLPDGSASERRTMAACLHTGQPVVLTQDAAGPAVLRIAIGGVLVTQVAQDPDWGTRFEDRLLRLEDAIESLKLKLETIARCYPHMKSSSAPPVESQRLAS
jgi:hypothetical protein